LHSNHRANYLQSLQGHKERQTSVSTIEKARAIIILTFSRNNADEETSNQIKKILEISKKRKIKWVVYREYAKVSNLFVASIYLAMLVEAQTLKLDMFGVEIDKDSELIIVNMKS